MRPFKPKMQKVRESLEQLGEGDPDDIFLSSIERDLILPRFQRFMIATDLCLKQMMELSKCHEEKIKFFCLLHQLKFLKCSVAHKDISVYRDRYTDQYLDLRALYRETKDEKYLKEIKHKVLNRPYEFSFP